MGRLHRGRASAGFTLLETMCAVAIAGILASIAYPGFQSVVQKARRSDALIALLQAQMAQERFRADHAGYGSLADIGVATKSPGGFYTVSVATAPNGYQLLATATDSQGGDRMCRHLRLSVTGADIAYASGPDTDVANSASVNKTCWGQ